LYNKTILFCKKKLIFAPIIKTKNMCTPETNNSNVYEKIEVYDEQMTSELSRNYSKILKLIGEDISREGLDKTPDRVARAMQFLLQGYKTDPVEILKSAMFKEDYRQMVIVKDIEIYSLCEHHLLPFFGKAHVAYIPNGTITGLSKIARVVDVFARRLQVQERLTSQIKECIHDTLKPLGVAVVIEAQHLCMQMRGIQKQHSITTTSDFTGAFQKNATRDEFIKLISTKFS
jgi:GTP cyclohydrolase IA